MFNAVTAGGMDFIALEAQSAAALSVKESLSLSLNQRVGVGSRIRLSASEQWNRYLYPALFASQASRS